MLKQFKINKVSHKKQKYRAAYILLNTDVGEFSKKVSNEQICKVMHISMRTIDRMKKRFVEKKLDGTLERHPTSRVYDGKIDGDLEAKIMPFCCNKPPEGSANWSLRLPVAELSSWSMLITYPMSRSEKFKKKRT